MDSSDSYDPGETRESDTVFQQTGQISFDDVLESVEEFSVLSVLGRGGFGTVYLAFDTTLEREVALKVPHRNLVQKKRAADNYLREARAIASLDHHAIIPVYRVSRTPEIPCYIVTKRIRGCHLGKYREQSRPPFRKIAEIMATVADALGYAHQHGIVHRDVKPGNILIDEEERPYVADFGLALRDADPQASSSYAGTPSYMSPEQARGEGHRVDGRSDLFSFGSVLYEMLTGQRPFRSADRAELYEKILYSEPDHPSELNPQIPLELARICMKLLSKSVSDRYSTAELVAAELRSVGESESLSRTSPSLHSESTVSGRTEQTQQSSQGDTLPTVIPKGLRSFSMHDADFYPQLLPGPYDREGVPESIRFWLAKLDPNGTENNVSVGLVYGPSGCGKTSLVRAGILPRLPTDVHAIYVQATAHETEKELIAQIESRIGPSESHRSANDVHESFAALRRSQRSHTVIFIDQFEQWLFTHPDSARTSLTRALRQCDGVYLQCILMVRDDFWMGVTRLMQALDIPIVEHQNVMAADLFDQQHARRVLAKFGAAYGKLPESPELLSATQNKFLDAAVGYLESNGRVICVQLALLTEMLKNRTWDNTAGLFGDGGTGLGMRFFEETFDSDSTPRRIQIHADGSLRVLRALLPDVGSPLKGTVRSEDDLWAASGYGDRSHFRQLVTILDRELHLITPTDRQDDESLSGDSSSSELMTTGYQLTHDFLVAPIQQWVDYHSRSTKSGKARLRLEEFSELYRFHPRPQSLPTFNEYLEIRRFTNRSSYNESQQSMMSAATKRHGRTALLFLACSALLIASVIWFRNQFNRHQMEMANRSFTEQLLVAETSDAIEMVPTARENPAVRAQIQVLFNGEDVTKQERMRAALVLADQDAEASKQLIDGLLNASADEVSAITSQLSVVNEQGRTYLLSLWNSSTLSPAQTIRAASIMANEPSLLHHIENEEVADQITRWLLKENPIWISDWAQALRPASKALVSSAASFLRSGNEREASVNAVNLIVDWAGEDSELLVSLVPHARTTELSVLCDSLKQRSSESLTLLQRAWNDFQLITAPQADPTLPWGSPWWCVGNRAPIDLATGDSIAEQLSKTLKNYEWIGGNHAVMVQQIPLGELETTNDQLIEIGYRIASVSTYGSSGSSFLFGLWVRDGIASRHAIGCTAQELREINDKNRSDRFLPDAITAYRTETGDKRYNGFWISVPNNNLIDADIYVDVVANQHEQQGWQRLGDRGMWLNRCAVFAREADGSDYFTSVRWKTAKDIGYTDDWNQNALEHKQMQTHARSLKLVSGQRGLVVPGLADQNNDESGVVAIWWKDLPVEAEMIDYCARREHLRLARKRIAEGWYPVSIDATTLSEDLTPLFRSNWWRGLPSYAERTLNGNQRRNIAVACFLLGDPEPLSSALKADNDPELRGAAIESFRKYRLDPEWLLIQIQNIEASETLRRACAMALALVETDGISNLLRDQVNACLRSHYHSSGPGLRSALESVATAWGLQVEDDTSALIDGEIQSVMGDRLVVIQPDQPIWLGSPENEPGRDGQKEPLVPVELSHAYAVATKHVTVDQFMQFQPDHAYAKDYAPTTDCPMVDVSWFDAVRYCRWLSEKEGIPESEMCYPPIDQIKPGMQLETNFLDRIGYRLPTEAEWEYACRGGSTSSRWFGFDPDRLDDHAWTAKNSGYILHPVAAKLPNDYGLFDMLGNAMDYCHTKKAAFPIRPIGPISDPGAQDLFVNENDLMINRGGAVLYQPLDARAAQRDSHGVKARRVYLTFRIVRTVHQD
ncbi:MAG: protein kinase [Planctomycetota bacterium]